MYQHVVAVLFLEIFPRSFASVPRNTALDGWDFNDLFGSCSMGSGTSSVDLLFLGLWKDPLIPIQATNIRPWSPIIVLGSNHRLNPACHLHPTSIWTMLSTRTRTVCQSRPNNLVWGSGSRVIDSGGRENRTRMREARSKQFSARLDNHYWRPVPIIRNQTGLVKAHSNSGRVYSSNTFSHQLVSQETGNLPSLMRTQNGVRNLKRRCWLHKVHLERCSLEFVDVAQTGVVDTRWYSSNEAQRFAAYSVAQQQRWRPFPLFGFKCPQFN
jgi:hypothetical protein